MEVSGHFGPLFDASEPDHRAAHAAYRRCGALSETMQPRSAIC